VSCTTFSPLFFSPLSSVEKTSAAKSVLPVAKPEREIGTGKSKTYRATAIDGEKVDRTAVSPSTETSETKPNDAVLETGQDVEVENKVQTPAASMSSGADGALETEDEDGVSVVTRPIEHDIVAEEIAAVEVTTDKEDDDESSIQEDDVMPVVDEEDDAAATGTTEIQENEDESSLAGPIETQAMADAPVFSVEKEVDDSESESAAKQPDLVESSVQPAAISSATGLIENDENRFSTVVKAPEAQSQVLQDIANKQTLAETEIKLESSEVELTSVVAEEVPLVDLETTEVAPVAATSEVTACDGETPGKADKSMSSDKVVEPPVMSAFEDSAEEPISEEENIQETANDDYSAVSHVDVTLEKTDELAEKPTTTNKVVAAMNRDDQAVVEAASEPEATIGYPKETIDKINDATESDLRKSEDRVHELKEAKGASVRELEWTRSRLLLERRARLRSMEVAKGEVDLALLETSKDVVVCTDNEKAIAETIAITPVVAAALGGSTNESTTQSKSSAASDNVIERNDDDDVIVDATCVPIVDKRQTDYDYEGGELELADFDYEEEESLLELDSSDELDSEENAGESDDTKSISAAEYDDDEDPILELKNVTAMTRVLIPEDQRQNMPRLTRWAWPSGLGRTNTSNSDLSFGGQQKESATAKLEHKLEPKGSPVSGSRSTKDELADNEQDPTKTVGILMKKFSGPDTNHQVSASTSASTLSKLTATVPHSGSAKEESKRKPLTDIEKARMYAASVLLETEEKTSPKVVPRSGFGVKAWLKL
jgi:hypothetical protein